MEDSTRETPNELLLTKSFNRQNLEVGKAMRWIGEVEDAKSTDDLITPAFITGRSIPDFENLEIKIASGLGKILTGHFKKQVTTAEGKGIREEISYGLTDCLDDLRLLQN